MEFLQSLTESRMTRNTKNQNVLTFNDCCERLYIIIMALELMRNYPIAKKFVQRYCKNTYHNDYKKFKISGTDAYNLMYFILGDESALEKLKDAFYAARIQKEITLPIKDIGLYLTTVANGNEPTNISQLFIRLENGLKIRNPEYRGIRRNLANYSKISSSDKKKIATKILYALRAKCRTSDIIDDFGKLVSKIDLEKDSVVDTEPSFSKPDISSTTSKELVFYKMLVDKNNILLIKAFLDYAKKGQSIPSNMIQAYMPIIQMVDQIVAGGPTYINLLKSIHKRAKKGR